MSKKNKKRIIAALYVFSILAAVGTGTISMNKLILLGQFPCNAHKQTHSCHTQSPSNVYCTNIYYTGSPGVNNTYLSNYITKIEGVNEYEDACFRVNASSPPNKSLCDVVAWNVFGSADDDCVE